MPIGRVVKSNSHIDYVCRVFDQADVLPPPRVEDYPFAGGVRLGDAVGIIYRSELVNPEYGQIGPRLAGSEQVRTVVSPDLINEQATLLGILLVGEWREGLAVQGVPRGVVPVHAEVTALDDAAFGDFHRGAEGQLQLAYYPIVLQQTGPIGIPLMLALLDRLERLVPEEERPRLRVLRTSIIWQGTLVQVR